MLGAAASISAIGAVALLVWGLYLTALQLAVAAVAALAGLFTPQKSGAADLSPRAETDDAGTVFRPNRGLGISPLLISCGLVFFIGSLNTMPLHGKAPWLALILGLAPVGALLMLQNVLGGTTGYLRLSHSGIELSHHLRRRSCDWDRIRDLTRVAPHRWWSKPTDMVVVVADMTSFQLPTGAFGPNGPALRALVEFYWRNPEFRGELTDGSAPRRLAATLGVFS